ncbi:MAG: hypothetical protein ACPL7D_05275, partial [Candidatus Sumerlaeaceae bacterium]
MRNLTRTRYGFPASILKFSALGFLVLILAGCVAVPSAHGSESSIDKADTAFLIMSAALVMLMTPALAFFYGGLVRA